MIRRKTRKKDIIHFLHRLNHDLAAYIKNSVESRSKTRKWSALPNEFKTPKCWEIKSCEKKICPAYGSEDYRCWLQTGTLCVDEVQGEFAKKYETCFECEVFHIISKDPLRALYEKIDILIFHLQDRAIKYHELAIKDHLTGLYNRQFFDEVIESELAMRERRDELLAFIMIDLDHVKEINDTLGHLAGDRLIIEAANLIKNRVRKADLVFRFGGDEFLVLMRQADCDKSSHMARRLLQTVDRWNKDHAVTFGCRLSFSTGCSSCAKGCNVQAALKEADERMYENKKKKRVGEGNNERDQRL